VRFGDPECQGLMARLDSDLVDALIKVGGCVDAPGGGAVAWKSSSSCPKRWVIPGRLKGLPYNVSAKTGKR
jgi:phosphoribosylamine-glycine ligase